MTISLILAILLGFGFGFPAGIWLAWKSEQLLADHERRTKSISA